MNWRLGMMGYKLIFVHDIEALSLNYPAFAISGLPHDFHQIYDPNVGHIYELEVVRG